MAPLKQDKSRARKGTSAGHSAHTPETGEPDQPDEERSHLAMYDGLSRGLIQKWLERIKRGFLHPTVLMMFGTPDLAGEYPRMTGSKIIQQIHEVSLDHWKPSPGSLYPILAEMQEDGLIDLVPRGNKKAKTYRITEIGRRMLAIITNSSILLTQPKGTFPPTMEKDNINYIFQNQFKEAPLNDLVNLQKFYLYLAELTAQMIGTKLQNPKP